LDVVVDLPDLLSQRTVLFGIHGHSTHTP
jgi:hypothetical protein